MSKYPHIIYTSNRGWSIRASEPNLTSFSKLMVTATCLDTNSSCILPIPFYLAHDLIYWAKHNFSSSHLSRGLRDLFTPEQLLTLMTGLSLAGIITIFPDLSFSPLPVPSEQEEEDIEEPPVHITTSFTIKELEEIRSLIEHTPRDVMISERTRFLNLINHMLYKARNRNNNTQ